MKLNKLTIKDRKLFHNFLSFKKHCLSVYAFENIYIWRGLFDIRWALIENNLCIFFKDRIGSFLYLPPLSKNQAREETIKKVFRILDGLNKNKDVSRIENIEEEDISFYRDLGYVCRHKSCDYLYRRADLVQLKGNKFKSKRASFNYFTKHYAFQYLAFSLKYKDDCMRLYNSWMKERNARNQDRLYRGMLKDSLISLEYALDNWPHLDLLGRLVKVNKEIKAFTFGFKLNLDTFCILFEITDLSIKGLSQFIFRKFSSELEGYKYINIMDDSGLENLKKLKLSYHPSRLIPAYIVKRENAEKYR